MKNKHFYQIFKLKIKPWIKYWLIKQTEFKGVLSDILEGISFYLTDSLNMKFKMFKIYGRTTQESTSGDNLISSENIDTTIAGVTYKSQNDGTILANGEKYGGAYANFTNNIVTLENDSYSSKIFLLDGTIKKDGVHQRPSCYLVNTEDSTKTYYIGEIGNPGISKTIPAGTYFIRIAVWSDNIVFTNAKIGFMLVKGSTIPDEFERYTGGEPAPNPIYPFPIKNTGDNGSVNERIVNKNILPEFHYAKQGPSTSNGQLVDLWVCSTDFFEVDNSKSYIWSYKPITERTRYILYYDKDKNYLGFRAGTSLISTGIYWSQTKYLKLRMDTNLNNTSDWQVEEDSTATSYVPHEEQNISFPLAQGQKLYEGSYPDDDEKVHHKMGEVVFDGSNDEDWKYLSESDNTVRIQIPLDNCKAGSNVMCDYFTKGSIYNSDIVGCTIISGNFYIRINKTLVTTISEFRTWLSSHNMKVQYELAEETTEDFTEEQKTAWEQIKKARTYKNITHISSEDETPAELKIQYWKEG